MEAKINLEQKLVELRKLLPYIKKEIQGKGVKYKSFKLDEIWSNIQLKMNEIGINTRIVNEENGNYTTYERDVKDWVTGGTKKEVMFLYQSDLTVEWVDADNPKDKIVKTMHAIGSNNDPAKAKGASFTYAFKYDLAYMFSIPMGEVDPDVNNSDQPDNNYNNNNYNNAPPGNNYNQPNDYQPPPQNNYQQPPQNNSNGVKMASENQTKAIYAISNSLNMTQEQCKNLVKLHTGKESTKDLTGKEASVVIGKLKEMQDGH